MTTVLAVHAHPDDIEHLAAGTLAVLAAKGHRIVIATLTAGECGSDETDLAATAAIRKAEAARAAALIGADYRCADLPDLGVFNDDASRRVVTELIRWAGAGRWCWPPHRPTTTPTMRPRANSPATPASPPPCPTTEPGRPQPWRRSRTSTSWTPSAAATARPRRRRRLRRRRGGGLRLKRQMLSAHESQAAWVARQHGVADHLASMETWTRKRGRDFGVAEAEGFRQYRHQPYPQSPLLQDLLGTALISG